LKGIGPLTDPPAHGGRAEDAFDVVIPSMPGYGFSERPHSTGWDPDHIASAWAELVARLRYERYVSQGGDWGSVVAGAMARQALPGHLAIEQAYPNLIYFHEVDKGGHFAAWEQPQLFSEEVRAAFRSLR
jgi:pimeloyl-ACP methyl ester carboxylesterase